MRSFVKALEEWLADPMNAAVLSWDDAGTTFRVKNPEQFMQLYRKTFNAARYNSFKRQLNMYGFRSREEVIAHPYFQRGRVDYERILKKSVAGPNPSKAERPKAERPKAERPKAERPKAEASKTKELNLFEFDSLHLCSTAGLVDLMLGLDF